MVVIQDIEYDNITSATGDIIQELYNLTPTSTNSLEYVSTGRQISAVAGGIYHGYFKWYVYGNLAGYIRFIGLTTNTVYLQIATSSQSIINTFYKFTASATETIDIQFKSSTNTVTHLLEVSAWREIGSINKFEIVANVSRSIKWKGEATIIKYVITSTAEDTISSSSSAPTPILVYSSSDHNKVGSDVINSLIDDVIFTSTAVGGRVYWIIHGKKLKIV